MAQAQIVPGSIEAHALARHVRMSPQKARLVMDLIRGQKAQDALQTLKYTPKRAAKHIEKRLRPAPMGRAFRYQKRTAHLWVGVAEHHVAAAERVAASVAEAEAQKGVRGTARRVRKALTGKQAPPKKGKK